ncbi:MAG: peptidoglycan-binding protein [Rhizobiaceae bacterium]
MARLLVLIFCMLWTSPTWANNVSEIQKELLDLGYATGKVDGKFGRQTAGAIEDYQNDWQLPVTGKITDELLARLKHKHPATKGRMQKVDNSDCEIWNAFPQPRELITFKNCTSKGPANESGEVVWRWFGGGDWQTATYNGDFRKGKMNGRGILQYPNGDRYDGEFQEDQRDGKGIYEWSRGNRYDGQWKNGKPDGEGTFLNNGAHYAGSWKNGCFSEGKQRTWLFTSKKACGFR